MAVVIDKTMEGENMKHGGLYFLLIALLLLSPVHAFAVQSSVSEAAAQKEEVQQPAAVQSVEEQEPEQDTDVNEEEAIEPEEGQEEEAVQIADPLYPWNNAMYQFNDKLYFWVMKPVAKGYSAVLPEDVRGAFGNFFYNLLTPVRFVGDIMQLKMKYAGNELVRLAYNSTVGVFGLVDAAKVDLSISRHDEDLGQTLGSYGIGTGFYIVWPFLGPSSLRDTVGMVGDGFLTPLYYVNPWEASLGIEAFDKINDTSLHIGDYEDLKEAAIEPYVAIRDAYTQHRKKEVEE